MSELEATCEVSAANAALRQVAALPRMHRRLKASPSVGALFAQAAALGCTALGYDRGLVVSIDDGELSARQTDVLGDVASDELRRRLLAAPVALVTGHREAELVRRGGDGEDQGELPSLLREALDLDHVALGLVAPAVRPLAIVVLDRHHGTIGATDHATVAAFAAMVTLALEHIVVRARVAELAAELRHVNVFTQGLMTEMLDAPVALPTDRGRVSAFPLRDAHPPVTRSRVAEVLSGREVDIADGLLAGRSNREIADELTLSPETVKTYVARILRKLNASNRVEAVTRIIALRGQPLPSSEDAHAWP